MLFDNSCGLQEDDCDELLEGVGEIIGKLSDTSERTRVQTMQYQSKGHPKTLVTFEDREFQRDPHKYVDFIRKNGECTGGGKGQTDLSKGWCITF